MTVTFITCHNATSHHPQPQHTLYCQFQCSVSSKEHLHNAIFMECHSFKAQNYLTFTLLDLNIQYVSISLCKAKTQVQPNLSYPTITSRHHECMYLLPGPTATRAPPPRCPRSPRAAPPPPGPRPLSTPSSQGWPTSGGCSPPRSRTMKHKSMSHFLTSHF